MMGRLFLLFMIMPILEIFVLTKVHQSVSQHWGSQNAWIFTLGMIVLAAMAGISLAKRQGLRMLTQAQEQLRQGNPPSQTALEGLFMLAGAAALIVPGYITDILGLLLLIPWTRALFVKGLKGWLGNQVARGTIVMQSSGVYRSSGSLIQDADGGDIIDVEPIKK